MISKIKYLPFLFKEYLTISRFEKWSAERISRYQVKAFRKIFKRAIQIPFYNDLYEEAGITDFKINSPDDLKLLPVIDKAICRNRGYEDFIEGLDLPGTLITPTSGSTGKPFMIRIPKKIEMVPSLKVIHAMKQFGWHPLMKGLEIWREDTSTQKNFMRKTGLLKSVSIFKPLEEIRSRIEKYKPGYLFCNRSFYMVLADYFEKQGFNYSPKYLLCTAEEVGKEHRKRLEEFFQAKLIDVFGCFEAPAIAYSCPEHDRLHVFQTTVIVELINKRMIDDEEYGDLVITNLINDVMPIIRYKTGDVVKVENSKCECGRKSQVIGSILGRSDDVIKFRDGRVFNYIHIWHRFRKPILIDNPKRIEQYKVWHLAKQDKLKFQFRLNESIGKEEGDELIQLILKATFSDIDYDYEIVDHIPLSKSGKFKIIEVIEE